MTIACVILITFGACSEAAKTKSKALQEKNSDVETEKSTPATISEETKKTATTIMQILPEYLQKFIDDADKLFTDGMYAEAVSAYRTAKGKLMSASEINAELIKKMIEKMKINADKAKAITDTARLHYGNAMQLVYEKRIEEALLELEEALSIYPKYQDARDALDSFKALHNLK